MTCEQINIGLSGRPGASSCQGRQQNEFSWLTLITKDERKVVLHIHTSLCFYGGSEKLSNLPKVSQLVVQVCCTQPAVEPWKSNLVSLSFSFFIC